MGCCPPVNNHSTSNTNSKSKVVKIPVSKNNAKQNQSSKNNEVISQGEVIYVSMVFVIYSLMIGSLMFITSKTLFMQITKSEITQVTSLRKA